MHKVVIRNISATQAIEHKNQLISAGLVIDKDFIWEYTQAKYDGYTYTSTQQTTFEFQDPALATFYQLKWT